jgi:hypothetical protein
LSQVNAAITIGPDRAATSATSIRAASSSPTFAATADGVSVVSAVSMYRAT